MNFFYNFSKNILNFFWDLTKSLILSIYFLFEIFYVALILVFVYFENLILSALSTQSVNKFFSFFVIFFNNKLEKFVSFYVGFLEYLKIDQISKMTSDILILVSIYSFFSVYAFTGSASVAFSNEGLWLSILSLAVIYFFYYLQTLENAGQNAVTSEIENLKKVMQKNSELAAEVAFLEEQILEVLEQTLLILEDWFLQISSIIDSFDSDEKIIETQIQQIVNSIFNEHFYDLIRVSVAREDLNKVIYLKDQKEEIISEIFENY